MTWKERALARFMRGFRGPRTEVQTQNTQEEQHMQNVTFEQKGNSLVITVDTSKRFDKSKSGKSVIVASTRGIVPISGLKVGLNIFTDAPAA